MSHRYTRASARLSQAAPIPPAGIPTNTVRSSKNSTKKRSSRLGREAFTARAPLAPRQATTAPVASDTLSKMSKDKSSAQKVTSSSFKPLIVEPSARKTAHEPVEKRKINDLPSNAKTAVATPQRLRETAGPPPVSSSSSVQIRSTKRKEPPLPDSPPRQIGKAFRVDVTRTQGFREWEASRELSTDEKLDQTNREIAKLKARIIQLEAGAGKRRKGN